MRLWSISYRRAQAFVAPRDQCLIHLFSLSMRIPYGCDTYTYDPQYPIQGKDAICESYTNVALCFGPSPCLSSLLPNFY